MFLKKILPLSVLLPFAAFANPAIVVLNNGDRLQGELLEETAEYVRIEHAFLGQLTLPKDTISSFNVAQIQPVENVAEVEATEEIIAEVEEEAPSDNGLFGTGWLTDWERRLDVGVAGAAGKSKNQAINIGFTADLSTDEARISSRTAFYRKKSEGELSEQSFFSSINRDWLIPDSQWFRFAGGRLDLDKFKDWDQRVSANGGVGYEFVNTEEFLFVGRSGVGFTQTFGGEREEFTPEGLIGIETRWNINEAQRLQFANTVYPSFDDLGEYRNLTTLDWILDLNTVYGIALKVGLINEYDSATERGISKNDFKYTLSLAWSL